MAPLRLLAFLMLTRGCASLLQASSRGNAVAEYAAYWEHLLLTEYQETAAELRERRKTWSRQRLEESGMSIFGAVAEPESELFGEKIVRIYKRGEMRFRDRYTRGDVLLLTPVAASVDPIPRECLIVDVGKDWLTAGVGRSWPPGLWEARKLPGFYQVRLDRASPQAPLRAQRSAFDRMRKEDAGNVATLMADLFHDSVDASTLTSAVPSRFGGVEIEEDARKALKEAKKATSFEPNQSQEDAIAWSLQRSISLIRGPPGTGKTRVAALLISTALRLEHQSSQSKPRVLAVTHSNGAADVLLEALLQMGVPAVRVGRPASVSPSVQYRTVIAMVEKVPQVICLRQKASDMTLESHIRSAAAYELKQCAADVYQMIVQTAPVVVTSCIGANQLLGDDDGGDFMRFPLVVLDEAAQTTEPALICALAAAKAEQVVLVGDTRQLPPTVTSMDLRDSLGVSPMARLEQAGVAQATLCVQYRMPPALLEHPSQYFYNGLIVSSAEVDRDVECPAGFPWPSSLPLAFVQSGNGAAEVQHNFGGKSNPTEAELVARIVSDLIAAGDVDDRTVAVISPYSKQVQLIRTELGNIQNARNVRVGTVDSFQGQETDVVVFSAVRSNPMKEMGFLRDSRRLCVGITRARRGLILVGDRSVLNSCRHWAALLESCERRGCTMEARDLKQQRVPEELSIEEGSPIYDDRELMDLLDEAEDEHGLFSPASSSPEALR
jgi:hypothetical protein